MRRHLLRVFRAASWFWVLVVGAVMVSSLAAVKVGTGADLEAGRRKAVACGACHGADGNASIAGMPSLAAQPAWFTHWALIKFRDGRRKDPVMSPLAANLTDVDMADLAAFYAAQPHKPRAQALDAAKAAEGKRLATLHNCTSCHQPDLSGQHQVPRVAGQDLAYLVKLLRAYKAQTAGDLEGLMTQAAQPLSEADIESLAHFMATALAPSP
jgi:cytochrome c553